MVTKSSVFTILKVTKSGFDCNIMSNFRAHRDYWEKLNPSTGRPFSAALSKPDAWGVTKGDDILKQQTESTTDEEIAKLIAH